MTIVDRILVKPMSQKNKKTWRRRRRMRRRKRRKRRRIRRVYSSVSCLLSHLVKMTPPLQKKKPNISGSRRCSAYSKKSTNILNAAKN